MNFPQDIGNVDEWKIIFDPSKSTHKLFFGRTDKTLSFNYHQIPIIKRLLFIHSIMKDDAHLQNMFADDRFDI